MKKLSIKIIVSLIVFIIYFIILNFGFMDLYTNYFGIKTNKLIEIIPLITITGIICIFYGKNIKEKLCNFLIILFSSYFMIILFIAISFMISMSNFD